MSEILGGAMQRGSEPQFRPACPWPVELDESLCRKRGKCPNSIQ